MRAFAETTGCRGQALLAYFGEQMNEVCGHCDNCHAGTSVAADGGRAVPGAQPGTPPGVGRRPGAQLRGGPMTVLFDEVGYKTLSVRVVSEQGLLELD
ncbi:RecQ family zinc-binding domain-containing protein [Micromonospora sp. BRA006-A]|nr:RecQ family zinc-binding domain-containing protein [Micromonospora sp. BRA006-A]